MSWHVRNGMHVCLMFFLSLTFATFTFWGLFNFFCQLSCVHSVISCFIKPFNHQPPQKMPRYFLIHAHVIPLTLFPLLWAEWRRRHVKKFLTLSRPLLFLLPNKDAHCNTGKRERKGGAENGGERERLQKKSWPFMDVVTSSFAILALVLHSLSFSCSGSLSVKSFPWRWHSLSLDPELCHKEEEILFYINTQFVCTTEYAFPYQDYWAGFLHINW